MAYLNVPILFQTRAVVNGPAAPACQPDLRKLKVLPMGRT
jgi:hypothetical protein